MVTMPTTERSPAEIKALIDKLTPGLNYLLVTKFEVPAVWIAELVDEGLKYEEMWPPLGSTRDEVVDSLKVMFNLDWDKKEGRQLGMKLLAVHDACKSKVGCDAKRLAEANAQRVPLPMDGGDLKACLTKLKIAYPGLILKKDEHPTEAYMGILEDMLRRSEWTGESLKKVVSVGDEGASKRGSQLGGDLTTMTVGTWEEVELPPHAGKLKKRYKTMGVAWTAFAAKHQEVPALLGLRIESYQAFSDYVTGPEVVGLVRKLDKEAWEDILKAESDVRKSWHEVVEEKGITLNRAILDSIGANVDRVRSGIWQQLTNKLLSKEPKPHGQAEKGQKRGAPQNWQGKGGRMVFPRTEQPKGQHKGKDGKAKGKGSPKAFEGKLKVCPTHKLKICFNKHLSECTRPNCMFCHVCCPEPGCRIKVSKDHGLWSH